MINTAVITGRLCADPELKVTPSGVTVTTFTVAIDRSYTQDGERKADFVDVVAWRKTADFICKYFRKGSMIAIQAHIQTRMFEDKNGNKRKATELIADEVSFCGGKASTEADEEDYSEIELPY